MFIYYVLYIQYECADSRCECYVTNGNITNLWFAVVHVHVWDYVDMRIFCVLLALCACAYALADSENDSDRLIATPFACNLKTGYSQQGTLRGMMSTEVYGKVYLSVHSTHLNVTMVPTAGLHCMYGQMYLAGTASLLPINTATQTMNTAAFTKFTNTGSVGAKFEMLLPLPASGICCTANAAPVFSMYVGMTRMPTSSPVLTGQLDGVAISAVDKKRGTYINVNALCF